jgi:hypothetical protein
MAQWLTKAWVGGRWFMAWWKNKKMGSGQSKSCQESKKNWFLEKIHTKKGNHCCHDLASSSTTMLHCLIVTVQQFQQQEEQRKCRHIWDKQNALGAYASEHGVAAAAKAFNVTPHLAKYWRTKVKDMLYHPLPWGGIKYRFVWTFFSLIVSCNEVINH